MADQADLASAVEEAERTWAIRNRPRTRTRVCTVCGEELSPQRQALPFDTDVCTDCACRAAEGG